MRLALRNAIAAATLAALRDRARTAALLALATPGTPLPVAAGAPPDLVAADEREAVHARAARALAAVERYWAVGTSPADPLARALAQASPLFDAGLFFEVHEVLEEAWQRLEGEPRTFVQGLIQVAVAMHHLEHGNAAGAHTLFAAGRAKLAPHAPVAHGVAVGELLGALGPWEEAARAGAPPPRRKRPSFRLL